MNDRDDETRGRLPRRLGRAIPWSTIGQVVGVYVAGSWVLLQVVDVLSNNLDLPAWIFRSVLGLLLLGLPATLLLTLLTRRAGDGSWRSLRATGGAILAITVVAALLLAIPGVRQTGRKALLGSDLPGVAVLPFSYVGPNESDGYLAVSIALKLATAVQRTGVFSPSWPAVERFTGALPPLADVGRELRVPYILTGKLVLNGDELELSVWLTRVRDNVAVWQNTFRGVSRDLSDFEYDIAHTVLDSLSAFVGMEPGSVLVRRYTTDQVADSLYSRGLYLLNQFYNPDTTVVARGLFERAIARDSAFAPAYVALALSISSLSRVWWIIPPREAGPQVRRLLERAKRLAPELVDVDRSLGWWYYVFGRDWTAAGVFLEGAIQRNPKDTQARAMTPFVLLANGRQDSALAVAASASAMEPYNPLVVSTECWILYLAGRYGKGIERCQFVVDSIQPGHGAAVAIGWTLRFTQRFLAGEAGEAARDSAAREILAAWSPPTTDLEVSGELSAALRLAELGHAADARRLLAADMALDGVRPLRVANVYAALGEMDTAWAWLDRAYEAGDPFLAEVDHRPEMAPFRADSRYRDFRRRMGFP